MSRAAEFAAEFSSASLALRAFRALSRVGAPLAGALPPEASRDAALAALAFGARLLPDDPPPPTRPELAAEVFGLRFANPVGIAAGFDKDARAVAGAFALGAGAIEIGTLTPRPQSGNPRRPRIARFRGEGAILNACGLPNCGVAAAAERLRRRRLRADGSPRGVVGASVGANADTPRERRLEDYAEGVSALSGLVDWVALNVSCPNEAGVSSTALLEDADALDALLASAGDAKRRAEDSSGRRTPLLLKASPDVSEGARDVLRRGLERREGVIDGIAATNTTTRLGAFAGRGGSAEGGLSGRPLFEVSTRRLARLAATLEGRVALIGVGGICSAAHAWEKIRAGASLIQVYSGLALRGPRLLDEIFEGLSSRLRSRGASSLSEVVGEGIDEWSSS